MMGTKIVVVGGMNFPETDSESAYDILVGVYRVRDWRTFSDDWALLKRRLRFYVRSYINACVAGQVDARSRLWTVLVPAAFGEAVVEWLVKDIPAPMFILGVSYSPPTPAADNSSTRGNLPPEANKWWRS